MQTTRTAFMAGKILLENSGLLQITILILFVFQNRETMYHCGTDDFLLHPTAFDIAICNHRNRISVVVKFMSALQAINRENGVSQYILVHRENDKNL